MKEKRLREKSQPLKAHQLKRKWQMAVACLAAVVLFCTSYALILPAVTLEKQEKELVCPISIHQHTEGCYQEIPTEDGGTENALVCGQADYVVHVHNGDCVGSDGNLVCPLPKIEAHQHSDACYESHQVLACSETENKGHVHGPECYTREQGGLVCEDAGEEHVHTDECYNWTDVLNCGMEEGQGAHQHTEGCYQTGTALVCGKQELHTHSEACYDGNGVLVCGLLELTEHVHSDGCFIDIEDGQQKLTEEEQVQVNEVIAMIDALPSKDEIEVTMAGFEGNGDDEEETAYVTALLQQSKEAYVAYSALSSDLQEHVTNADALTALEWLWSVQTLELTEGEQAQVDEVIAMIDALPTKEEADAKVEEYGGVGTDNANAYLANLAQQGQAVYAAYSALTSDLQECVTNRERLLAMKAWWEGEDVQPAKSIFTYADELGDKASVSLDIFDKNGKKVVADKDGNYNVTADDHYTVRLGFSSVEGMKSGYYYCTFPSGLNLTQSGNLVLKDNAEQEHTVGRWYFEGDRMIFYLPEMPDLPENDPERGNYISNYTEVSLFADVYITFEESDTPLEFDGNIKVNVHPNETPEKTKVSKWNDSDKSTESSIVWKASISGHKDSHIVGSTLRDAIKDASTHFYSDADLQNGIRIMACHYSDASNHDTEFEECCWIVYPGAEGLHWTESGWTYEMPESVGSSDPNLKLEWNVYKDENGEWQNSKAPFVLGDENWIYYVEYTSTIKDDGSNGRVYYENTIDIDGDDGTAKVESEKGSDVTGNIVKTGNYNTEKNTFDWTITATIPGTEDGAEYNRGWKICDEVSISADQWYSYPFEEENIVSVMATVEGRTYSIPRDTEANSSGAPFCWKVNTYTWKDNNGNIAGYGANIYLYSQCMCTEHTCPDWDADDHQCKTNNNGYCSCWCRNDKVTITIQYSMDAKDIIDKYGGKGYKLNNYAGLQRSEMQPDGEWHTKTVDEDNPSIPIPGIFTKEVTDENPDEYNNYTMEFEITVNEAMSDLSKAGPITIEDTMSDTLIFMQSTLIIKSTDAHGNEEKLSLADGDYTVSYESDKHEAKIVLQEKVLGPYMYTLTYRAGVYIQAGTSASTYSNTASIQISTNNYTAQVDESMIPTAVASGATYSMSVKKVDADDPSKGLPGAEFGLYSADDTLIASGLTTGEDGLLKISTDVPNGILFFTHTLYYVQELEAPEGYQLDDTKYYFWFCNNEEQIACSMSNDFGLPPINGKCIYTFQANPTIYDILISNKPIPDVYELPDTGGSGTLLYTFGGALLTGGGLVYFIYRRRRKTAI